MKYKYNWKNNEKRKQMYNRECVILARGRKNSVLIEFVDNAQREITSRYSIKKG